MMKTYWIAFFLLAFYLSAPAQKDYTLTAKTLFHLDSIEREMYILKDAKDYMLFKMNHGFGDFNSKVYDLYLLNKTNMETKQLLTYDSMKQAGIDIDLMRIEGATLQLSGSLFDQNMGKRKSFTAWYQEGQTTKILYDEFAFKAYSKEVYQGFEKFTCLGKIGDSTFAFADNPIYSLISPKSNNGLFATRKLYTYDYIHHQLKQYAVPALPDTNFKKQHEEVSLVGNTFRIIGFYRDQRVKNTTISGAYSIDLENDKITCMPLMAQEKGKWKLKKTNDMFSFNSKSFQFDGHETMVFELHHTGNITIALVDKQLQWCRYIPNLCNTGPYPNQIAHHNGVLNLVYLKKGGIIYVRDDNSNRIYSCSLFFVDDKGNVQDLKGPKLSTNIILYTDALTSINNNIFALFYTDLSDGCLKAGLLISN